MQITFLGTAAANAYPEAFCKCERCQKARSVGGKSLRKRSSALINNDLLVDLGPDIMSASQIHTIDLTHVQYCLQTHSHADHMDLSHLLSRSPGFGVVGAPRLHFYASTVTLARANKTFIRDMWGYELQDPRAEEELNLRVHSVEPFQPLAVGPYQVTAFPAQHAQQNEALLYAIAEGERCVFYATDTAALPEETWEAFLRLQVRFDLVVLDHTYGPTQPAGDHLSAFAVIEHMQRMREEGILKENGRLFATHIAHEGNPIHPELEAFATQHGYAVAYDGLSLEI